MMELYMTNVLCLELHSALLFLVEELGMPITIMIGVGILQGQKEENGIF